MWTAMWVWIAGIGGWLAGAYGAWTIATSRAQKRVTDIGFALAESRGDSKVWAERAQAERNLRRRADLEVEEWKTRYDAEVLRNLNPASAAADDADDAEGQPLSVREADRMAMERRRREREAAAAGERAQPDAAEDVAGDDEAERIPGEYEPVLVSERGMPPVNRLDQGDGHE